MQPGTYNEQIIKIDRISTSLIQSHQSHRDRVLLLYKHKQRTTQNVNRSEGEKVQFGWKPPQCFL